MNATTKVQDSNTMKILVTDKELMQMLSCGRSTAVQIGQDAHARVQIGRRVLWNVGKISEHLNNISA